MQIDLRLTKLSAYIASAHGGPRSLGVDEIDALDAHLDGLCATLDRLSPGREGWGHSGREDDDRINMVTLENTTLDGVDEPRRARMQAACVAALARISTDMPRAVDVTEAAMRKIRDAGGDERAQMKVLSHGAAPKQAARTIASKR